jgi:hypothetical protein
MEVPEVLMDTIEQVVSSEEKLCAILPHPEDPRDTIEITYRKKKGRGKGGKAVTYCELCMTTVDDKGNQATVCSPVPCPKGQILGPTDVGKNKA